MCNLLWTPLLKTSEIRKYTESKWREIKTTDSNTTQNCSLTGIWLGFQKGMVPSFKKGHLLEIKCTSPGRGNVFVTHPKVKVILWGFYWDKTGF
jgi:hypothetical protein